MQTSDTESISVSEEERWIVYNTEAVLLDLW